MGPNRNWTGGLAILATLAGCSSADTAPTRAPDVPVLSLGAPTLEIGSLDGPEPYSFAAVESVIRLPDGRIAVADGGATSIGIYDADGDHVLSWGRAGDGPGEFNSLAGLYPFGADSLLAAERDPGVLAVFDLEGNLGRLIPGPDLSGDSTFTLGSWLHGRFWVERALTTEDRISTRATLDRLPALTEAPGYRTLSRGDDGTLWIREPARIAEAHVWTRIDAEGTPLAIASIPARFTPTHFRSDEVLGVWRGEADVHFARAYSFARRSADRAAPPDWLAAEVMNPPASEATPDMDEVMDLVQGAIRQMAGAQEVHYSTHSSYADAVDSLSTFDMPEDLWADVIKGDARGWVGVFAHPDLDRICGLAYGFGSPAGWSSGRIACAPPNDNEPGGG